MLQRCYRTMRKWDAGKKKVGGTKHERQRSVSVLIYTPSCVQTDCPSLFFFLVCTAVSLISYGLLRLLLVVLDVLCTVFRCYGYTFFCFECHDTSLLATCA